MSKLARALALTAMLAAMHLAGLTAIAQAHTTGPPTGQHASRSATDRQVAAQQQAAADTAHRRELAQERYYGTWGYEDPAIQQALAQERTYGNSAYGDTSAPAPAEGSGQAGWRTPALGVLAAVLAAVLALVAGVAVVAARRANRGQRAGQTV
jgi:hypothetical protein